MILTALKIIISIYVATQIAVMWLCTPHHPLAYAIDVVVTFAAIGIWWMLWSSRRYE